MNKSEHKILWLVMFSCYNKTVCNYHISERFYYKSWTCSCCTWPSVGVWTAEGSADGERTSAVPAVLFRFTHPEECWSVLLSAHTSLPPSQCRRKQRRPRSCRPWLQSLGCTGAPSVPGPLLEGIQLAKHHRSPVFNNNHLKLLQLARSYKEMESRKM